jgi:hypothetical protein
MKLVVVLARYPTGTPKAGYLAAYVVSDHAKRGRNLLAGMHITGVPYAHIVVKREIGYLMPGAEITFEGPEGEEAKGRAGEGAK